MNLFVTTLTKLTQLKVLNLSGNELGDDGMTSLATTLVSLRKLTDLGLSFISISVVGAKELVNALLQMPQIEILELRGDNL